MALAFIDGFELDVAVSEEHGFESDVTSYPIEDGSNTTDHVHNSPLTVTIEGVVSDTPIGAIRDTRAGTTLPSDDALAHLKRIREAREPVTIETSLGVYDNMVMTALTVPRDARTGHALRFTAAFTQVTIVENERTTVVTRKPNGRAKQKLGNLVMYVADNSILSPAAQRLAVMAGFN